ncbi:alpha/beta fold hydrolase [Nocardiopsis sp. HNM0947]|uniref:Alpha/beta fold hydrolase n=1 Tax=Nocardiopsis coralli TaxID=2772213 RepID=A0ABR9P294_9ACTN|nr:alpha/beta fold hydrolase [Nocardiopsis coralli]
MLAAGPEDAPGGTLLCLHGIGGDARSFLPQLRSLAGPHRVVAWDAPGYGGSRDLHGDPGTDTFTAEAVAVLDHLGAGSAHVLGVSWGGVTATRMALTAPGRVRSLILAGSTRGSGVPGKAEAMRGRAASLRRDGAAAFAADRAGRLLAPGADPALHAEITERMASSLRPDGYAAAAEAMATTRHTEHDLARVRARTLVLVGAEDTVTGPAESKVLAEHVPGARYTELAGAGHAANQERPDAFDAEVTRFLADDHPTGGTP